MKNIIISSLYLLVIFGLSRFVFEPTYLYYEIWWLDIPMHILGGFGVASLANSILSYRGIKISYWNLFAAFIVIAIIWEIYEYVRALQTFSEWSGWPDTIKDLVDGWIGMSVAYLFLKK